MDKWWAQAFEACNQISLFCHNNRPAAKRLICTIVVAALVLLPGNATAQANKGTPLGMLFTPANMPNPSNTDIIQAAVEIAAIGSHASYMWEWPSGDTGFTPLQTLVPLFRQLGLQVFLQFSPTAIGQPAPPSGYAATFSDPQVRALYLQDITNLAKLQPDYLNAAAEINLLYYLNKSEWDQFKTLYQQAYQQVKQISPKTQVGVSYHLDLFFGDTEFNLPADLGPQDFVGFTTYPAWTVYKGFYPAPDQLAAAYYDRIRLVLPTEPIVFAEAGWPSGGSSSLTDQNLYVSALPKYMANTKPVLITWAMEHDALHFDVNTLTQAQINILQGLQVNPTELFDELNTMGLLASDDNPKPAYLTARTLMFGP